MTFYRKDIQCIADRGVEGIGIAISLAQALELEEGRVLKIIFEKETRQKDGGHLLEIWQIDDVISILDLIWKKIIDVLGENWELIDRSQFLKEKVPYLISPTPNGHTLGNALGVFLGSKNYLEDAQRAGACVYFG